MELSQQVFKKCAPQQGYTVILDQSLVNSSAHK
jgi:hypothetical protein